LLLLLFLKPEFKLFAIDFHVFQTLMFDFLYLLIHIDFSHLPPIFRLSYFLSHFLFLLFYFLKIRFLFEFFLLDLFIHLLDVLGNYFFCIFSHSFEFFKSLLFFLSSLLGHHQRCLPKVNTLGRGSFWSLKLAKKSLFFF